MRVDQKDKPREIFYKNFIGGIGWIAGVTIGFTFLISLLSFLLSQLGGLPVIGGFFAAIVATTQKALESRSFVR